MEHPTTDDSEHHNSLMSPELAAVKTEILSRKSWAQWHLDCNYHNYVTFMKDDPADVFGICYLDVWVEGDTIHLQAKTKNCYAQHTIPVNSPRAVHQFLTDIYDAQSPHWINRNHVQFQE